MGREPILPCQSYLFNIDFERIDTEIFEKLSNTALESKADILIQHLPIIIFFLMNDSTFLFVSRCLALFFPSHAGGTCHPVLQTEEQGNVRLIIERRHAETPAVMKNGVVGAKRTGVWAQTRST